MLVYVLNQNKKLLRLQMLSPAENCRRPALKIGTMYDGQLAFRTRAQVKKRKKALKRENRNLRCDRDLISFTLKNSPN